MATYDPFTDKRAERDTRELIEREQLSQEQLDLQLLMDEEWGRRIAHRLLQTAGVFRMSYVQGDPYETAFREGGRNQGNKLLAQLMQTTPDQYAVMLEENHDAR